MNHDTENHNSNGLPLGLLFQGKIDARTEEREREKERVREKRVSAPISVLTFRLPMSSMNCKMSARPVLKQGFLPALEAAAAASWQDVPAALVASVPAATVLTPSTAEISACCRGSAASEDMANFVVCCCCCCGG